MSMLSALPVLLLAVVAVWFVWPLIADPISRRLSRRQASDADKVAEHLFAAWSKYGQGTPLLIRTDRN